MHRFLSMPTPEPKLPPHTHRTVSPRLFTVTKRFGYVASMLCAFAFLLTIGTKFFTVSATDSMEHRRAVLCVVAFVGLALPFALLQRGQSGQPESFPRKPITDNAVPIAHLPFSEVQRVPGCASEEFWAKATLVACQPFQASDPHPRIVVTGGAGFVGGHVLRALRARGLTSVKVIDNFWRGRLSNLCPGCRCSLDLERDVCVRDLTSPTSAGDIFEGADAWIAIGHHPKEGPGLSCKVEILFGRCSA